MTDHDSRTTTDHDTIRQWAEARGGRPEVFEDRKLAFLHQDETADGGSSRFNTSVSR